MSSPHLVQLGLHIPENRLEVSEPFPENVLNHQ